MAQDTNFFSIKKMTSKEVADILKKLKVENYG